MLTRTMSGLPTALQPSQTKRSPFSSRIVTPAISDLSRRGINGSFGMAGTGNLRKHCAPGISPAKSAVRAPRNAIRPNWPPPLLALRPFTPSSVWPVPTDVSQRSLISGTLILGVADIAQFGEVQIEREAGETIEAFEQRAHDLAIAAGASTLVLGGLPKMKFEDEQIY
jgi:hypothetical protein